MKIINILLSLLLVVSVCSCEKDSGPDDSLVTLEMTLTERNDIAYEKGDLGVTYVCSLGKYEVIPTSQTVILVQRDSCSGFSVGDINGLHGQLCEISYYDKDVQYVYYPSRLRPQSIKAYNPNCIEQSTNSCSPCDYIKTLQSL
jgi:hypothetical protein